MQYAFKDRHPGQWTRGENTAVKLDTHEQMSSDKVKS